jgi:hypothetical protein
MLAGGKRERERKGENLFTLPPLCSREEDQKKTN